jgi:hypothetical protein
MGTSSANSTRQYDLLKNLLTCLEPSEQAHDERVPVEKDRGLLSALSSVRDFHFPDPLNGVGSRKGDDQPQPTTTPRTGIAGDGHLGGLRTAIYGLQDEHQVPRLPRATQLPPIPGLPSADAHRAVPTRVRVDLDKRIPTPTLRRLGRTFSGGTAILIAGAIAAVWVGYFVVESWPPAMDLADAQKHTSETRLVTLSPSPQADPPSIDFLTAKRQARLEPQMMIHSEEKPTESGIEARSPEMLPATEYSATTPETNAIPESKLVHQALPASASDPVLDVQETRPLIEREKQFVAASAQVSTCFPSASAVRQDNPEAWPSWTLRAPGHEGTKCWHATTRAEAYGHRSEMTPKKETVFR